MTRCLIAFTLISLFAVSAFGADWPMWRFDASRSAATPGELPEELRLSWRLQLPAPRPAWPPDQEKLQFDAAYHPVVAGTTLLVSSMNSDSVSAYDTRSGRLLWRRFVDGPVRFAPVVYNQSVYFVSDDGCLYCASLANGQLKWKVRGGPSDERVLGNDRLVCKWPARGGPVLYEDTIYFAAGIWPFMGVFIHAVDAESGQIKWTNSDSGSRYLIQQHNSPAFAGMAPQGYLTATDKLLLVSGGRTVPAAVDRLTGEFLYYRPGDRTFGKDAGGFGVVAGDEWFVNGDGAYELSSGTPLMNFAAQVVSLPHVYSASRGKLSAFDAKLHTEETIERNRFGLKFKETSHSFAKAWEMKLPVKQPRVLLKAGGRLYITDGKDALMAIDISRGTENEPNVVWKIQAPDVVVDAIAADDRLFVVTRQGGILCYADEPAGNEPAIIDQRPQDRPQPSPQSATIARLLSLTKSREGYAVVYGVEDGELLKGLVDQTDMHVVGVDRRAPIVEAARVEFTKQGVYGRRVAMHVGDESFSLPPYLAKVIVCSDPSVIDGISKDMSALRRVVQALRPYGGAAVISCSTEQHRRMQSFSADGFTLSRDDNWTIIRRNGPLPGAGSWTHHNADSGNTLISPDSRVKAPLGLLWFGGPSNQDVLPRHGHGPTPQVIGGRLFIEGPDMLRAVDVYTGTLLWQRELKGVGLYYNNTGHHPGAGAVGGNFVSTADGVYVAYGRRCLRLRPDTGETVAVFALPADESGERPVWGSIHVYEDLLIAGSSPVAPFARSRAPDADEAVFTKYGEGSRRIVVLNRHTGETLWTRDARHNFRHNAIAIGGGRVYCIDRLTDVRRDWLRRRGLTATGTETLYALDARSGEVVWQTSENVFGTWLSYSEPHDLVLQAGSKYRDRGKDEAGRNMATYRGATGEVLWRHDDAYAGPPLIHGEEIITQGGGYRLLDGKPLTREHPLTGEPMPWRYVRAYGCNTAIGCQSLLTFRSAAAGYFDLSSGGTGNLGGFRSSCTSNLIPADGVLNAPDYTRTCRCSYQNQCSLALIHDPAVEMWTFSPYRWDGKRVERLGINFGAPGDRADGALWLDYPSVGGSSPDVPVEVKGENMEYVRHHPSTIRSQEKPWVYASAVRGARSVRITLAKEKDTSGVYTVRLYFANINGAANDDLTFDVSLQGKTVAPELDVVTKSGGPWRGMVREFQDVEIADTLSIQLAPSTENSDTILCGIELQRRRSSK